MQGVQGICMGAHLEMVLPYHLTTLLLATCYLLLATCYLLLATCYLLLTLKR
jgi:hypothetical protein